MERTREVSLEIGGADLRHVHNQVSEVWELRDPRAVRALGEIPLALANRAERDG